MKQSSAASRRAVAIAGELSRGALVATVLLATPMVHAAEADAGANANSSDESQIVVTGLRDQEIASATKTGTPLIETTKSGSTGS